MSSCRTPAFHHFPAYMRYLQSTFSGFTRPRYRSRAHLPIPLLRCNSCYSSIRLTSPPSNTRLPHLRPHSFPTLSNPPSTRPFMDANKPNSQHTHISGTQSSKHTNHKHSSVHPAQHQTGTGTEGKHEWKQRAPYRIHENDDNFEVKLEGSCHCGLVQYQLSRDEPLSSKLCHCTTCQTQHAAPFQWAAIFHKTDINFTNGHHNLEWYDPTDRSITHTLPCKVRCSFCHSPIMDEGRNMILLFPSLIHFKDGEEGKKQKEKFRPKMHMFYPQRVMDIPDNLPKWTGINESSELLEGDSSEAENQKG